MNTCLKCGHLSNDDITDYKSYTREGLVRHQWYCKKCHHTWDIIDQPVQSVDEDISFNFSLPNVKVPGR